MSPRGAAHLDPVGLPDRGEARPGTQQPVPVGAGQAEPPDRAPRRRRRVGPRVDADRDDDRAAPRAAPTAKAAASARPSSGHSWWQLGVQNVTHRRSAAQRGERERGGRSGREGRSPAPAAGRPARRPGRAAATPGTWSDSSRRPRAGAPRSRAGRRARPPPRSTSTADRRLRPARLTAPPRDGRSRVPPADQQVPGRARRSGRRAGRPSRRPRRSSVQPAVRDQLRHCFHLIQLLSARLWPAGRPSPAARGAPANGRRSTTIAIV